jgi:hypothetical protein
MGTGTTRFVRLAASRSDQVSHDEVGGRVCSTRSKAHSMGKVFMTTADAEPPVESFHHPRRGLWSEVRRTRLENGESHPSCRSARLRPMRHRHMGRAPRTRKAELVNPNHERERLRF